MPWVRRRRIIVRRRRPVYRKRRFVGRRILSKRNVYRRKGARS